jgi:HEAT repeat protein/cyclophilin family peptidyl-prolyl cis-trans isomerase
MTAVSETPQEPDAQPPSHENTNKIKKGVLRDFALSWLLLCAAAVFDGCASAPPAPPKPLGPTPEQKMAWILRLEDQRVLRDPTPPAPPPPAPVRGRKTPAVVAPPSVPDLLPLLTDSEARIRRRAALAVGRVGLREGVAPLVKMLSDTDPEVRQMAAFALGLIGDKSARDPLVNALADQSPLVQGSAAEALGLIDDATAAEAIGRMIAQIVQSGVLAPAPTRSDSSATAQAAAAADDMRRDTPEAAFRLGVFALVRLKAYDQLAGAILDPTGEPRVRTWPVAFALERLENPAALRALLSLTKEPDPYTRAFAVKGLGALKSRAAAPTLLPLLSSGDRAVVIETVRALGRIGDSSAAAPLLKLVQAADTEPHLRLEAISALGGFRNALAPGTIDTLLDLLTDKNPSVRAASLRSVSSLDPDGFITVLSGLDPDSHWSVRATLADVLGGLTPEAALPRLTSMLSDTDQRVVPHVLASLVKLKARDIAATLLDKLKADDPVVRMAAANGIGELKPPNGPPALEQAYRFGDRDTTYIARAAALAALAKYGDAAKTTLADALQDKDWAVRRRAAALLAELDPTTDAARQIRPAPTTLPRETYEAGRLVDPKVSTEVYVDTDRGTIQIELAVLDAPLTVENFVTLARKGFFDGLSIHRVVPDFVVQDGDPRGDGEGGPGYTIRDELSERPYLRGTVGMALDWADTGGSQFFITHSPQPHLDAKYTVFGRVIAGMEIVDQIQQWDVIRRVRVWDGGAR